MGGSMDCMKKGVPMNRKVTLNRPVNVFLFHHAKANLESGPLYFGNCNFACALMNIANSDSYQFVAGSTKVL